MEQNTNRKKIFLKRLVFFVLVFFVGGMGAVISDRYVFPKLSAYPVFSKYKFLKRTTDNVTIINRTEEISVKEDDSAGKIAAQAMTAVVEIISMRGKKNPVSDSVSASGADLAKTGIGIVATSDGLIITYRDAIIENNGRYKVYAFNGSSYDATLKGIDEFTNLAYLKIEASNLPVMAFADPQDFYPGKKAIALGTGFGRLETRYAVGNFGFRDRTLNISGKTLASSEKLEGVMRMDIGGLERFAGGPIIDFNGEMQGIIGSVANNNQEIYFAIPANVVKDSLNIFIEEKLEKRPFLGLYYLSVTPAIKLQLDLPADHGAIIYSPSGKQGLAILSNSPAEKSELKMNDIILGINDQEINIGNPLSMVLNRFEKGQEVKFKILRNGKEIEMPVKL